MAIADELQKVLPGVYIWQAFCSSAKVELTSHSVICGENIFLVDPIRLGKDGLEQLDALVGKISAVLLTNGNHERDAAFYRDRYQVPVYATADAAKEFSIATEDFPASLPGLEIIPLPGAGPGEIGLYDREKKLLLLGDILINLNSFAFAPLPDKYATNPKLMQKSIELLTSLDVNTICFAHGLPVTSRAAEKLRDLVKN